MEKTSRVSFPAWLALILLLVADPIHADLAQTIAHVKPSVVIVGAYKATDNPRFVLHGAGFVVSDQTQTDSNLVITNAHVLGPQLVQRSNDAPRTLVVQIRTAGNEWEMRKADLLAIDSVHDLALLRMEGLSAPALAVGDSDAVREGDSIAFTGFPLGGALGFSPVTHRGVVSSITTAALPAPSAQQLSENAVRALRSGTFEVFQIDGTAYPGNSGGPMFDTQTGKVLGVLNMVFVKGTRESALSHPSGISYAIPARYILRLVQANAFKTP